MRRTAKYWRIGENDGPKKLESVYQMRDVRRDGSIVDVEVYSSRISIGGDDAILATLHDISDRKQLEEKTQRIKRLEAMATLSGRYCPAISTTPYPRSPPITAFLK